jgi:hypothetical protein
LPACSELGRMSIEDALKARRSSFGQFQDKPLALGALSGLLAAGAAGAALPCELSPGGAGLNLVGFHVFANHVDGLDPGVYEYRNSANALLLRRRGQFGAFLQNNYYLTNYNLEQAAAVLVPVVRVKPVIDAIGPRGYRLANSLVGAAAQAVYTAAACLGVGCGAALGFDNLSYIQALELEATECIPLLILMVGPERPTAAECRFENV